MNIYSVTQLTREIKSVLEQSFPRLWVEGEISNYKRHSSGHIYFTLKDETAQISCAMWKYRAGRLLFQPQHGMKILLEGDVQVYERGGNYQLIVQQMQPAGMGALQLAFEQLKRHLHAEGLFDESRKKPLPVFPERLGVVTSPTGAALRDIISVLKRRMPGVQILLYPVRVQGEGAAAEIAAAIADFNRHGGVDVLIVGRGGGSLEDLWAFNEEIVARAIHASTIPVISAVGHEVDFSIADFVADHRAPTPSAAAEIAVRDRREILGQLQYFKEKTTQNALQRIARNRDQLQNWRQGYGFRRPLDEVYQHRQRLDELRRSLTTRIRHQLTLQRNGTRHLRQQLETLNPQAILKRGYSITMKAGKPLRSTAGLDISDRVTVQLAKGGFTAAVKTITPSTTDKERQD